MILKPVCTLMQENLCLEHHQAKIAYILVTAEDGACDGEVCQVQWGAGGHSSLGEERAWLPVTR